MTISMTMDNVTENQELLNLIGDDAFTRLCMVFGGMRLYVANTPRSRQRLNIVVGEDMAEKIIFNYQGNRFNLPMLSSLEINRRHQAIIQDFKSGMSKQEIAIKYEITTRQVRRIILDFKLLKEILK